MYQQKEGLNSMREPVWTIDTIRQGIDQYKEENGRYPTAFDFDSCPYLPSARQIQRRFGGLEELRKTLSLPDTNYTKGESRREVYTEFAARSLEAEDTLETALIAHFSEPYVHTQKRYYRLMRNRWDFFVYYHGGYLGIDIFSTARKENIMNNIRHKLLKYAKVPATTRIFFIVDSPTLTDEDILLATRGSAALKRHPNITVVLLDTFLSTYMPRYSALQLPNGISLVLSKNIEQK